MSQTITTHPSAARTATPTPFTCPPPQTDYQGWTFTLTVTAAAAAGGLKVQLVWTDPANPTAVPIVVFTAPTLVTGAGTYTYTVQPGVMLGGSGQLSSSLNPHGGYSVNVVHADSTNSFTYAHTLTH